MSIGPFQTLRTRPIAAAADAPETPPLRRCRQCGAVLSRTNPGDMCRPCDGVRLPEMLDDWMLGLMAEAEGETHAITEVAKLLSRAPDPRPGMLRCERCGRLTERRGNSQRFCPPCRLESDREANRRWHKAKSDNAAPGVSTGETPAPPESEEQST